MARITCTAMGAGWLLGAYIAWVYNRPEDCYVLLGASLVMAVFSISWKD